MATWGRGPLIRLDGVATAPLAAPVVEAMRPWLGPNRAHPLARHPAGRRAAAAIEHAREQVAKFVGRPAPHVVFTSGGTESANWALRAFAARASGQPPAIAVSRVDPLSLRAPARLLAREGASMVAVRHDRDGRLSFEDLRPRPADVLAFAHAHPELGTIRRPRAAAGAAARIVVDATLTSGRQPLVGDLDAVDGVVLSFHRMGGPAGVGALVADPELALPPLIVGGAEERGFRSGMPDVASIVGAGACCELPPHPKLAGLGGELTRRLLDVPGTTLLGPAPAERLAGHAAISFAGIDGEALILALADEGVLAETGSPCADVAGMPSRTLIAAGHDSEIAAGTVVFCMPPVGGPQDQRDLDAIVAATIREVGRLRRVSGALPTAGS